MWVSSVLYLRELSQSVSLVLLFQSRVQRELRKIIFKHIDAYFKSARNRSVFRTQSNIHDRAFCENN